METPSGTNSGQPFAYRRFAPPLRAFRRRPFQPARIRPLGVFTHRVAHDTRATASVARRGLASLDGWGDKNHFERNVGVRGFGQVAGFPMPRLLGRSRESRRTDSRPQHGTTDRTLKCASCGDNFVFSAGEQLFFREKQFQHEPRHCKKCKAKRVNAPRRAETPVTCSTCGASTTVPFVPRQNRPVLCRGCFQRNKPGLEASYDTGPRDSNPTSAV